MSVALVSGGFDSPVLVSRDGPTGGWCLTDGQPAALAEKLSARKIAKELKFPFTEISIRGFEIGDMGKHAGVRSPRVVAARNLMLASLAVNPAVTIGGECFHPVQSLRGTSPVEGLHAHQKQWVGTLAQHAPDVGEALLKDGALRWNRAKHANRLVENCSLES